MPSTTLLVKAATLALATSSVVAEDAKVHLKLYAEPGLKGDFMETDVTVDVCYTIATSGCFDKLTQSLEWTVADSLTALNGTFYSSIDCSGEEALFIENMESEDGSIEDFDKEDLSEAKSTISSFAIRTTMNVANMTSVVGCVQK